MNSERSLTVKNQPYIYRPAIYAIALVVIINLGYTIFTPPPHIVMYIVFFIFTILPTGVFLLWAIMFRVKVNDTRIFVRKRFGLVNYNFDISDITNVEWQVANTASREIESVIIYTLKGKKLIIHGLMTNSNKFLEFIKENVETNKLTETYKVVRPRL